VFALFLKWVRVDKSNAPTDSQPPSREGGSFFIGSDAKADKAGFLRRSTLSHGFCLAVTNL